MTMFRIYFGQLGQGKTYGMTRDVYRALKAGDDVFCNYDLNIPAYQSQITKLAPEDVLLKFHATDYSKKGKRVVFALDEGWLLFDSYLMTKMDLKMRTKLASMRKHRISLFVTSQRVSAVHKAARDLCNEFWRCDTFGFGTLRIFRMAQFELDGAGNLNFNVGDNGKARAMQTKIYLYRSKIASLYDTMQSIDMMFEVEKLAAR